MYTKEHLKSFSMVGKKSMSEYHGMNQIHPLNSHIPRLWWSMIPPFCMFPLLTNTAIASASPAYCHTLQRGHTSPFQTTDKEPVKEQALCITVLYMYFSAFYCLSCETTNWRDRVFFKMLHSGLSSSWDLNTQ